MKSYKKQFRKTRYKKQFRKTRYKKQFKKTRYKKQFKKTKKNRLQKGGTPPSIIYANNYGMTTPVKVEGNAKAMLLADLLPWEAGLAHEWGEEGGGYYNLPILDKNKKPLLTVYFRQQSTFLKLSKRRDLLRLTFFLGNFENDMYEAIHDFIDNAYYEVSEIGFNFFIDVLNKVVSFIINGGVDGLKLTEQIEIDVINPFISVKERKLFNNELVENYGFEPVNIIKNDEHPLVFQEGKMRKIVTRGEKDKIYIKVD